VGTNVFANGLEVSAKQSDNQSIAAMPDVCLSPPSPPAGPIPIPYPNFSSASDTSDGTKTVKIAGDEVGMKDQSNYKTSKGDEAATKSFGMGVVSHSIQGKTYFAAWSSDVMFEGANAVRFGDMTTHNHGSPSNPPSATASVAGLSPTTVQVTCEELDLQNQKQKNPPSKKERKGKDYTLTTAQYKPARGKTLFNTKAFSKRRRMSAKKGWAQGVGKTESGKYKSSNLCGDFKYAKKTARPLQGHTESKIIESLFKTFASPVTGRIGGTLTMRIQWQQGNDNPKTVPCDDCRDLMCAAMDCGLKIKLCSDADVKNNSSGKEYSDCP
jgi:hypothetical protein